MSDTYPLDLLGYDQYLSDPVWPVDTEFTAQRAINFLEGGNNNLFKPR